MGKYRTAAGRVEPVALSRDRVASALDSLGAQFDRDDTGDCLGAWDGHLIRFFCFGEASEVLAVRAFWTPEPPVDVKPQLCEVINDWHGSRAWPKAYVQEHDGRLVVGAEVTVDYEHGVTDHQIGHHLRTGIGTSLELFTHLEGCFEQWEQWMPDQS